MKRKGFDSEQAANKFAAEVNGKVRMIQLPDYMSVIIRWVVEWEEV